MICRNCRKTNFLRIAEIGSQPISSIFLNKKKNIKKYSLDLFECQSCKLIQLSKIPNLKDMYGPKYGYKTSVSKLMVGHLKNKFFKLKKFKILKKNSNILDIGSNDGTFLNFFSKTKREKWQLFGIDPSAEAFIKNYNKKIKVIVDFFNQKIVQEYFIKTNKKFSIITSFAMFYDIENPNEFCKNISRILEKKWNLGPRILIFSSSFKKSYI